MRRKVDIRSSAYASTFAFAFAFAFADGGQAEAKTAPEAKGYLDELAEKGLIDKTLATPKRLAQEVRLADEELTQDLHAQAAARLYAVVESSAYADFSDADDFIDAEYRLGLALKRGGAGTSARQYLLRVLVRGTKTPFYRAALRSFIDSCLDDHVARACIQTLDAQVPNDVGEEITYLRGRAAFDSNHLAQAEDELKRVSTMSRFYSSALYLRGVIRVKQNDLVGAQDAFCSIADVKDGDTLRFYIDGRYYALRDLARLGLGRLAHEERRYEDAFYHYFLIPSDSHKLADALFESAWSSLERREYDLGARLVDEYVKRFPRSPRIMEAHLLRATLEVKTCRFADAENHFETVLKTYEPLLTSIDRALSDASARQALALSLMARAAAGPTAQASATPDAEHLIADLLDVDPQFFRLARLARELELDASDSGHVETMWRNLQAKLSNTPPSTAATQAAVLLEKTHNLGRDVAAVRGFALRRGANGVLDQLNKIEQKRRDLSEHLNRVAEREPSDQRKAKGIIAMVQTDLDHANHVRARLSRLRGRLEDASGELVLRSLGDLRRNVEDLVRRARLGKIDAVVGQKRKLERQIEDLAAGRFPPEMFGVLHLEGLIQDDEEYWPPEKEKWADEYEGYK